MDPITLSAIASVLLKTGPSILRSVGGLFGGETAKTASAVADAVTSVSNMVTPSEQQRVLEDKLKSLSPEQQVRLEELKVQLELYQVERERLMLNDAQAAHHEQQETIRNGDTATDEYVRRTRPRMARLSMYAGMAYVILLTLGQQVAALAGMYGHTLSMPSPDWNTGLMLLTPALAFLGFRTVDGFARYSKSSKDKAVHPNGG